MRLYLVQHGEAKREVEDPLRPLSESGREDIQRIAKYAKKKDIKANRIFIVVSYVPNKQQRY